MSLADSVQLLVDFLRKGKGKTTLLTGAGISVDSGIRVSLPDRPLSIFGSLTSCFNASSPLSCGFFLSTDARQAYRGPGGTYTIRKHRPIFYGEFIQDEAMRRRYWARRCVASCDGLREGADDVSPTHSFLGYPPVRRAESNPTHYAMAALQKMGYLSSLITVRSLAHNP